jgi:hypothetical protein
MKLFPTVLLLSLMAPSVTNNRPARRLFTFTNCECTFDEELATDPNCRVRAARNVFGVVSFSVTLKRPVKKFVLDVQSYRKGSSNIYSKGGVHIVANMCDFDLSDRNFALKFLPSTREAFRLFVQKCPYQVSVVRMTKISV